ncbi:acyl dehydratase [Thermobifida alba]|jgi:acyl dehydratase|uniref:Acyl dehydratase n=1 Tax=Thermobifida alba TaxID=53522 RepID=A0ABY4KYU6_THEAE|nr:MaoC/PaaZ C-terminal domain-containing protein [Thermobifida alba]UPT20384.1 acyl dehydratase [Thermobifida alba]HLU96681.1 MaoC/PaaZ C-terminal domain-containing protein [Thermobifida alba]
MTDTAARQRYFEDVAVGEELPSVAYPLNVYRLVMAAGSNRDFNSIHHNTEYARRTGAKEMYANTSFLLSTWERCVRDWIGPAGTIRSIRGFRMRSFNYVGDTLRVHASVADARVEDGAGVVEIAIRGENSSGVSVGPGTVEVTLPRRGEEQE